MLHERLLGVVPTRFLPSIPNLPYQYTVYVNFEAPRLDLANDEVLQDPDELLASKSGAAVESAAQRTLEAPIRGGGDFEEMLAAALQAEQRVAP